MFFSRHPHSFPRSSSRGFIDGAHAKWLLALLLTILASYLAFAEFSPEAVPVQVKQEASSLKDFSWAIEKWSASRGGTAGLSMESALQDHLVPPSLLRKEGRIVRTSWGTDVSVEPDSVLREADGFEITYARVPAFGCRQLARVMGSEVYDLRIDGKGVMGVSGADDDLVSRHCNQAAGSKMTFVFHPDLVPGTAMKK